MNWVGLGWTHGLDSFYLFITIVIKLIRKKKNIPPATWIDKQNIHKLVFQLSYKQNISNWIDKQNIYELVFQLSYKQIGMEWEHGSGSMGVGVIAYNFMRSRVF